MRVKICGIRNTKEALLAVEAGADAVGFLCGLNYRTNDEMELPDIRAIAAQLPPLISTVLVTHSADPEWVVNACQQTGCTTLQLHGEYALEWIPALRVRIPAVKIIKAVNVRDESAVESAKAVAQHADGVLLDSQSGTRIGGTGKPHDWTISARIVRAVRKPVILAGGLRPENVESASAMVRPFAVDVNSGVESPDGSKSPEKLREFVRLARRGYLGSEAQ
jgi:phosphoribosylanthranilate isomerase